MVAVLASWELSGLQVAAMAAATRPLLAALTGSPATDPKAQSTRHLETLVASALVLQSPTVRLPILRYMRAYIPKSHQGNFTFRTAANTMRV